jgi:hypothetical protein
MLHKEFWGLLFLGFVFWIIAASSPQARIENGCRPVGWSGNVVTSLSALVLPAQQATVQSWFDKLEYGCRYLVWRLFYQEAYNTWVKSSGLTSPAIPPLIGETPAPANPEPAAPAVPASAPTAE